MKNCFYAVALAFLITGAALFAQEIYATLAGTITDPSGATVPAASVTVHSNETDTDVRTITSDASGNFSITNLPAGVYTVTVKAPGFKTFSSSDVVVHIAEKRSLEVRLETGQVDQVVNVNETTTPVETASAAQMGTITGTQVRELELNNRNFEQLVLLQPGVTSGLPDLVGFGLNNTTTISVNGARSTANNWTVDGADINDSGSNGTLLNVPSIDSIQEFTLGRSTYDAQYGRSGGGQVLVATNPVPASSMGTYTSLYATISSTRTRSLATWLAHPNPRSGTTIMDSLLVVRSSSQRSTSAGNRRHSSSGLRSGGKRATPAPTRRWCPLRRN